MPITSTGGLGTYIVTSVALTKETLQEANKPRHAGSRHSLCAVSYTHLDVYKRQKNFRHIEEESNKYNASRILQQVGKQTIVVNPPFPPMTETEMCLRDRIGEGQR